MKIITQSIKTTFIGGVVFLVPLAVIAALAGKVFQVIGKAAVALSKLLPFQSIAGIAVVNLVTLVLIIILCFIAGRIARCRWGKRISTSLEAKLYAVVPRYAFVKSMAAAFSEGTDAGMVLQPVWVKFDDYSQIAFEVNRAGKDMVTIYLPGSPDPWSGSIVHVAPERVETLDVEFMTVVKSLKKVGIDTQKFTRDKNANSQDSP